MINSTGIVNIKVDVPVKCYYPALNRDKSRPLKYYKTFFINDVCYTIQDYAVVNDLLDIAIVKLLCIYKAEGSDIKILVRKYVFARNLKEKLLKIGCTTFDEDNEVIEDFTREYTLNPNLILRKCCLVLGREDENCVISQCRDLNPLTNFFCRFMLKSNEIFPILTIPASILSEYNLNSAVKRFTKHKKKAGTGNITTITIDSSDSNENTPEKMTGPKLSNDNVKMSAQVSNHCPIQRNSVKRNLNKSFGDSPGKNANSILNYSIITDEEVDNSLVLKLKVSESNKIPLVILQKRDDESYATTLKPREDPERPQRKSSRLKVRKSYADYISPAKSTPRKRSISINVTDDEVSSFEGTPVKSSRKKSDIISEKRQIRTPKRYQDNVDAASPIRSARRSLRLTSTEEVKENVPLQRSTRLSKRNLNAESEDGIGTPERKVDLDESIRRTILKVRLRKVDDEMGNNKRKSRVKRFFYDSSSDDDNFEENVKGGTCARTPRTRSKSTSSNQIESPNTPKTRRVKNSISDDNYSSSSESIPKTPKTRKRNVSPTKKSINNDKEKPIPNTPKTRRIANDSPSREAAPKTTKTPRTRKHASTPKSAVKQTPKTPRNRAKLIREGVITPSMHSRSKAVAGDTTPLMRARSQLHVSYVPSSLPCREKEYCNVFGFLEGRLLDGYGGCMYVSGVPGTGKTATVTAVVNHLLQNDDVPKFSFVSVNGMRLTEPRQSYVEILKQLTGKTVPWEQAQSMLEERFTKSKKLAPVVMVIDELDVLCTKRQDVVYNLLDWPSKAKSQLIVVTIANTMDLPERLLMSRVTSRLGLTRLTFQAYTHKQLQEIVTKRLTGTDSFNPDAIQFVARKVASVSGDARRALDICRRAAEIAETEGKGQLVNMSHVNEALNAMITQPKVRAIKNCSRLEQLVLQSIVAEVERTGVEETTFADVYKMLVSCAAIDGFRMVSCTIALSVVSRLSACRLLLTDQKCNDINQRIVLNVSVDDVYYALKKE